MQKTETSPRPQRLQALFTEHPAEVGETYGQHFRVAMSFAITLLGASLAAFAHALIPACCETTASRKIKMLHARMTNRTHTPAE